jgi:thiamine transporter ThiT
MNDAAADYHHGDQDISEQVASYRAFGALSKYGSLVIGVLVLMLSLWFCVGAGFLGGLIPGLVLLALGLFFLRSKPAQDH